MGAAIATIALRNCIADTLDAFLEDHGGLAGTGAVTVCRGDDHTINLEVDGFEFTLTLGDAHGISLLAEPGTIA